MKETWALALAGASLLAAAPEGAVPVEAERFHRTIFRNEWVRAYRVTLPPGESTGFHVHAHDDAAVRLSVATVASETMGRPPGEPERCVPGMVSSRTNEPVPLTHRVNNVGTTTFDVLDVEVLKRPDGPASAALAPPATENARLRVYRWELPPGGSSPSHAHTRPYLIVAATDVALRMTAPDGAASAHPVKTGDLHWIDSKVTHALGNDGTSPGVVVEFELK